MVIYGFRCEACGHEFEARVPMGTREICCDWCMIGVADKVFRPDHARFKVWYDNFNSLERDGWREEGALMRREARRRGFAGMDLKPHDAG